MRDRPFLSDFFITVRLLKERAKLVDADFHLLALAFNRTRVRHPFYLTAWVFLPDPAAAGHAIGAPVYPLTISLVMKSIKTSSVILMNRRRAESGEKHKPRTSKTDVRATFFDRALRTVKEYNEKVEYIHLNPSADGLVERSEVWRWSSVNEYSGVSAAEQERRCGLTIDRVNMPSESNTRI